MSTWLAVALGGAVGSTLRHGTGLWLTALLGRSWPWGTLAVNLLGSVAIGALAAWLLRQPAGPGTDLLRAGLMVGLLGGFTTFSAFSLETLTLFSSGRAGQALAYAALSVGLCLAGVWLGTRLG